jgi:hypothetical protein
MYYLNTDYIYVKFAGYNLKVLHHYHVWIVDLMIKISLHTKFHMHSSNYSLNITIKVKAIENFHMAALLLFLILQREKLP